MSKNKARMTEENDVVIAEGTVQPRTKEGVILPLIFCNVFEMQNGKIRKLIGYIAQRNKAD